MAMESISSIDRVNTQCVQLCPVVQLDKAAARFGTEVASNDYGRHVAETANCQGPETIKSPLRFRCPLYGVEGTFK